MDEKTLVALKASIAKWEKNAEATSPGHISVARGDCPLCDLFNNSTDTYESRCAGCPVYEKTEQKACRGTPYEDLVHTASLDEAMTPEIFAGVLKLCADEVEFLKSLLPAGE